MSNNQFINNSLDKAIENLENKYKKHMNRDNNINLHDLKKIIQFEINNLNINISEKTNNSLVDYLNIKMSEKYIDYKNVNELVKAFDKSYIEQSKNQYKYFIENILNARYKADNRRLIHMNSENMKKIQDNFEIDERTFISDRLESIAQEPDIDIEKFQELSKEQLNYTIKNDIDYLKNRDRIKGNKIYTKANYHEYNNKNRTALFLTFTLNKGFRKYTLKKEYQDSKRRKEVKWGDMKFLELNKYHKNTPILELLDKGYNELNARLKYFNNNIQKAISRHREKNNSHDKDETITNITAFEFVKAVQFHTHLIVWVNDDEIKIVKEQFENFMNHYNMNKYERKAQDLTQINPEKGSATTYLLKYILKQNKEGEALDGMSQDEIDFYSKSSKFFGKKYKMIRMSKFKENKEGERLTQDKVNKIYSYLKSNYNELIEMINEQSKIPLYIILEKFYFEGIFEFIETKKKRNTIDKKAMKEDYLEFLANYKDDNKSDILDMNSTIKELKSSIRRRLKQNPESEIIYAENIINRLKNEIKSAEFSNQNDKENKTKLPIIRNLKKYVSEEEFKVITSATFIKDEKKINKILSDFNINYEIDLYLELDPSTKDNFFYEDMLIMNYEPINHAMYTLLTAL